MTAEAAWRLGRQQWPVGAGLESEGSIQRWRSSRASVSPSPCDTATWPTRSHLTWESDGCQVMLEGRESGQDVEEHNLATLDAQ